MDDAINTHPIELIVGSYIHLWTTVLLDMCGLPQHILSIVLFLSLGSVMAVLNHTRWEFAVPMVYTNADHDTHHRLQKFNYAQYTHFWDLLMCTYRPWTLPPPLEVRAPVPPTFPALSLVPKNDAPHHCVVTGGNGMVGSRLVEMLAERGARTVLSLDLKLPDDADVKTLQRKFPGVFTFAVCDINDTAALTQHFQRKTAVFHVAALVGPYFPHAAYDKVNHLGTISVVDACKAAKVPTLVITSSPSTKLDGSDVRNLREDQLRVPTMDQQLQEYSRTKALGEKAALAQACDGLRICAVAPHQVLLHIVGALVRLYLVVMDIVNVAETVLFVGSIVTWLSVMSVDYGVPMHRCMAPATAYFCHRWYLPLLQDACASLGWEII
jgi:NAD(P)-dependent dehydrogenase (short-subunit alcohol dehydrogenase family)